MFGLRAVCVWTGLAIAASGCGSADLSGSWAGSIRCGDAGGVDLSFDAKAGGKEGQFAAAGLLSNLTLDGVNSDIEIDSTWTTTETSGPQKILVDASCLVVQESGDFDMDCSGLAELGWDGVDFLEASISNFLESENVCNLSLQR